MKKCPDGMLSEVKYDGERVQVHKKGNEFRYFSRSLKPVMQHKVSIVFSKNVQLIQEEETQGLKPRLWIPKTSVFRLAWSYGIFEICFTCRFPLVIYLNYA